MSACRSASLADDAAGRRGDEGALHHAGPSLLVEQRDQRLADTEFGDDAGGIEGGVGAQGVGGDPHRLLVTRGKGAQGVLHPVAKLPQHAVGDISRALGHEVDTHPFERMSRTTSSIFSSSALGRR